MGEEREKSSKRGRGEKRGPRGEGYDKGYKGGENDDNENKNVDPLMCACILMSQNSSTEF